MTKRLLPLARIVRPILKKYHIKKCAIFGSVARGEETKKSDIDFLIDPPSTMTLFDLSGLHDDLAKATHRSVDVVTRRSLHTLLRPHVLRDAITIYEA